MFARNETRRCVQERTDKQSETERVRFTIPLVLTVFTKSAGLSVKTSKISFCLTKYFILSDKCLTEITKNYNGKLVRLVFHRTDLQNWALSYKNCSLPDSCPAAEKRFHEDCSKDHVYSVLIVQYRCLISFKYCIFVEP